MQKRVVIIGGGINGCTAANYLQRNGCQVTILDRRDSLGGACSSASVQIERRSYQYAAGATVLGMMQDFVLEETGLARRLSLYTPKHPAIVDFESLAQPAYYYDDPATLAQHLRQTWGEQGDVSGFTRDRQKVCDFLRDGYRHANVPNFNEALEILGPKLTSLWITGTAKDLLDHYFTSDKTKMFFAIDVTESGPVSVNSRYSAFNLPLMASGTVFDGNWGFVRGGIANVSETLAQINQQLGVQVYTGVNMNSISSEPMEVNFTAQQRDRTEYADMIVFATDPLVAATLMHDRKLIKTVSAKKMLGTSGKLVMFFKKPVQWKNNSGIAEFNNAFRFIISTNSPEEFEVRSSEVEHGSREFSPGYFEIYCEGAGQRQLGEDADYDTVAVFFKNLALRCNGEELTTVKKDVGSRILSRIINPDDLVGSVLITPKDIQECFFISQANIDHVELCCGQTFHDRNYSNSPQTEFYQFGGNPKVFYCGSGAYPGGSVSGTAGYMCATQILRNLN